MSNTSNNLVPTILYGVSPSGALQEVFRLEDGLSFNYSILDYYSKKYFPRSSNVTEESVLSMLSDGSYDFNPWIVGRSDFLVYLTSLDGYYFDRRNLQGILSAIRRSEYRRYAKGVPSVLRVFEAAYKNKEFKRFFVLHGSVGVKRESILDFFVKDAGIDSPSYYLSSNAWDLWGEYLSSLKLYPKLKKPSCRLFLLYNTLYHYEDTLVALFNAYRGRFLRGEGISSIDDVKDYAKLLYQQLPPKQQSSGNLSGILVNRVTGSVTLVSDLEGIIESEGGVPVALWSIPKQRFIPYTLTYELLWYLTDYVSH